MYTAATSRNISLTYAPSGSHSARRSNVYRVLAFSIALFFAGSLYAKPSPNKLPTKTWTKKMEGIQHELLASNWQEAERHADRLLDSMTQKPIDGPGAERFLSLAALYRGVARAGLGDIDEAQWDWHISRCLDSKVAWADLTNFGVGGGELMRYRQEWKTQEESAKSSSEMRAAASPSADASTSSKDPITKPVPKPKHDLKYKETASRMSQAKPTLIRATIDEQGDLRAPTVVAASNAFLALAALETMREWEYEPAFRNGRAVPVSLGLSLSYKRP